MCSGIFSSAPNLIFLFVTGLPPRSAFGSSRAHQLQHKNNEDRINVAIIS